MGSSWPRWAARRRQIVDMIGGESIGDARPGSRACCATATSTSSGCIGRSPRSNAASTARDRALASRVDGQRVELDQGAGGVGLEALGQALFSGYCLAARFTAARACRRATSHAAALVLDHVIEAFSFPVQVIQVDGGSEFMAAFETACQAKGIRLFILPPKSPELNGAVERTNGAWRYEFYACYGLPHQLADLKPPAQ